MMIFSDLIDIDWFLGKYGFVLTDATPIGFWLMLLTALVAVIITYFCFPSVNGNGDECEGEPNNEEHVISKMKIERQKAISDKIRANLDEDDLEKEKMIETQQMQKIFALLQTNEDKFGKTSMEDLQRQLAMYKAT